MKFECPNCKKSGQVDASKVPESGVYANCPQCGNRFLVRREELKDFEFEPVVQPISKVANVVPPVMPQQSSPPQQPQPTPKDKSTVASPKQETEHQTNGTLTRKQLYQAAVGKNIDYYLPIFERFDRDGKTSVSWNWSACFGGWLWCYYRRMNLVGLLYLIISMILGVFESVDTQGTLAIPLILIYLAMFFGFGMYANAFYYIHINKKIRSLDLKDKNVLYQESFSKMFKPNKAVFYVLGVFIGLGVIGIIAAIAIPQFNRKEEAPAPPPNAIYDPFDGKYHPIPAPAPAAVVDAPATRPTLDEIYADKLQPVVTKKVYSPGWTLAYSTTNSDTFIDFSTVKNIGNDTITFMTTSTYVNGGKSGKIAEWRKKNEANCAEKKIRVLETTYKCLDGTWLPYEDNSPEWDFLPPGSNGYNLVVAACDSAQ